MAYPMRQTRTIMAFDVLVKTVPMEIAPISAPVPKLA